MIKDGWVMAKNNALIKALRKELAAVANPKKAPAMQAYMKSEMPYLGVSAVPLRKVCKEVFGGCQYKDSADWRKDVLEIWRGAKYREERHCAIELTAIRQCTGFQRMDALPMYEEMVVTGAWWDYVDSIAGHRLNQILRNEPAKMKRVMLVWSRCGNTWKRRSAILCQLKMKQETDLAFLYACIEPSISSPEFFLRKAIGWALRQYAWTDPDEVGRYVAENENRLSGLSKREALKNILKNKTR